MNAFPDSRQEFGEEDLPMGPTTPRSDGVPDAGDDALLPPFARGSASAPAGAGDGAAAPFDFPSESFAPFEQPSADPVASGEAEEELPWLVTAEESGQEAEMPAWLDLDAAAEVEPAPESDDGKSGEEPGEPAWGMAGDGPAEPAWEMAADAPEEPAWEIAGNAPGEPAGELAADGSEEQAGESPEGAPALAERFESIARLLRARGVAGVLEEGKRDPLGLLLTGFALGYLQRDEDSRD
jgi:hypothetical protein